MGLERGGPLEFTMGDVAATVGTSHMLSSCSIVGARRLPTSARRRDHRLGDEGALRQRFVRASGETNQARGWR
jgi:hypothetical protein